jgi:hypothetical protein
MFVHLGTVWEVHVQNLGTTFGRDLLLGPFDFSGQGIFLPGPALPCRNPCYAM